MPRARIRKEQLSRQFNPQRQKGKVEEEINRKSIPVRRSVGAAKSSYNVLSRVLGMAFDALWGAGNSAYLP